ncbi:RES family NAD+ phosphorylase [soil metagenome]
MSGDGAKIHGGRFNPRGKPALYLALTVEGMFSEMGYGFVERFEPLTVCAYDVDVEGIVDLRTAPMVDMAGPWEADIAEGREPASWRLAKRLMAEEHVGILVPSFAHGAQPGMANLVLWKWGPDLPHRVTVHDPSGRLPKDPLSWR